MKKLVYEKPEMLVEGFVATQSVALNCGMDYTHDPIPMNEELTPTICKCGNNGHHLGWDKIEEYDKTGPENEPDGVVTLFNANTCELVYESFDNIVELGNLLAANGNNSWNSNKHRLVIGGVQIPSI